MKRTRRRFNAEFKQEAVRLVRERGVSVAQAADEMEIHQNLLRTWLKAVELDAAHPFPGVGQQKPEQAEITRLRREVARLKMERDNLKKSHRVLREGVDVKFGFIVKHRGTWPVDVLCDALGVSRSGFYAWCTRAPSAREQFDDAVVVAMRQSFIASDRTYGVRRVWPDVCDAGLRCGRERIARLMRYAGLRARPKRRQRPQDAHTDVVHTLAPNILDRQFTATAPNQKWVADFTYVWTREGWLFVAVVLDLFSRRVVGWSMQSEMTTQLVADALMMAVWRRGRTQALVHHSDRGSQYTSAQFQRLLRDIGVTCSMSRAGNVWDNAVAESFFSTLKTERVHRHHYRSRNEARADIFDFIERFYNTTRRHSKLGYISPLEFEQQHAVA
ncbi:MAG: IS3 family transposase [Gemmatimonadaceae bacterium]